MVAPMFLILHRIWCQFERKYASGAASLSLHVCLCKDVYAYVCGCVCTSIPYLTLVQISDLNSRFAVVFAPPASLVLVGGVLAASRALDKFMDLRIQHLSVRPISNSDRNSP